MYWSKKYNIQYSSWVKVLSYFPPLLICESMLGSLSKGFKLLSSGTGCVQAKTIFNLNCREVTCTLHLCDQRQSE